MCVCNGEKETGRNKQPRERKRREEEKKKKKKRHTSKRRTATAAAAEKRTNGREKKRERITCTSQTSICLSFFCVDDGGVRCFLFSFSSLIRELYIGTFSLSLASICHCHWSLSFLDRQQKKKKKRKRNVTDQNYQTLRVVASSAYINERRKERKEKKILLLLLLLVAHRIMVVIVGDVYLSSSCVYSLFKSETKRDRERKRM